MSQEMLDKILNAVVDLKINMDIKFEQVEERFKGIDLRLDRVDDSISNVEQKLDSVERRLDRVEQRLDSVELKLNRVEGELGYIRTAVIETGRTVKGHEDRIIALEGRN